MHINNHNKLTCSGGGSVVAVAKWGNSNQRGKCMSGMLFDCFVANNEIALHWIIYLKGIPICYERMASIGVPG